VPDHGFPRDSPIRAARGAVLIADPGTATVEQADSVYGPLRAICGEAAAELPVQSRLALTFAEPAPEFEQRRITADSALRGLASDNLSALALGKPPARSAPGP
jgi:hypothetical protein